MIKLSKKGIELAVVSAIEEWAYYNCCEKEKIQLITKVRNKINQFEDKQNETN